MGISMYIKSRGPIFSYKHMYFPRKARLLFSKGNCSMLGDLELARKYMHHRRKMSTGEVWWKKSYILNKKKKCNSSLDTNCKTTLVIYSNIFHGTWSLISSQAILKKSEILVKHVIFYRRHKMLESNKKIHISVCSQ